jgi:uncharacterized protein (DUF1499 family)
VLLASTGAVAPMRGFVTFQLGILLGALAVVLAILGLVATRASTGRGGRGKALRGLVTGGVMLFAALSGARAGAGLPLINDITTSPDDPPTFEVGVRDPSLAGRDWSYRAGFAAQQRAAYPDLAPIALAVPPAAAYEKALAALNALGFEVTLSDAARGMIEARSVSKLFHFVDDVAVRIRPAPSGGGSVIDIRSKSRDGKGDLGANAARIRAIASAVAAPE